MALFQNLLFLKRSSSHLNIIKLTVDYYLTYFVFFVPKFDFLVLLLKLSHTYQQYIIFKKSHKKSFAYLYNKRL
jgi:hypothetical protein